MRANEASRWLRICVTISIWRDQFMEALGTAIGKPIAWVIRKTRDSNVESP